MRELAQFPTPTIAILIFLMREVVSYAQPIGWGKMQVARFHKNGLSSAPERLLLGQLKEFSTLVLACKNCYNHKAERDFC
ncbi:MAG: hypothetical protein DMF30_06905 [Verrucomicrobia bacterium]|nr:MAG: hypothetical protein DMF30_06905 [Verrucomicrobiota bacterium]